jgi:hypothetical protein
VDLSKAVAPNFDPASPEYRWKLWVTVVSPTDEPHLVVFWRRIFGALFVLALVGWLAAAFAVTLFIRQRHDFAEVSYLNIVLPHRWPLHRQSLGRHYVARGQEALARGEFPLALAHYIAGVGRDSSNLPARRQLAIIYFRFGQPHNALRALTDGLDQAARDLDYLKLTFGALFELQEDARVLEFSARILPAQPEENLAAQFLALSAATARYHRGDYDGAERLLRDWRLARSAEGLVLAAKCEWERGYPELALAQLQAQRARFPGRDEIPLQLIRYYRELGRDTDALNESLVRHVADPASPGPRIDLLHSLHRTRDHGRLARETDRYVADYTADSKALILLAWFAADAGDLGLVRRVEAIAREKKHPLDAFDLINVQALIAAGQYHDALAAAETSLRREGGANPQYASVLAGLRALACFGAGNPTDGEVYLQGFLAKEHLRASDAVILSRRLAEVEAQPQARRVLATAALYNPLNQAALTELVRLDARASHRAGLVEFLPKLLTMRKPSRAALQEALLALDDTDPAQRALRATVQDVLTRTTANPEPES